MIKVSPPDIEALIRSPKPALAGGESSEAVLNIVQLQDFVEESVPDLTKILSGSTQEYVFIIMLKGKVSASLGSTNVIKKNHPGMEILILKFERKGGSSGKDKLPLRTHKKSSSI